MRATPVAIRRLIGLTSVLLLAGCSHLHPGATDRAIEGTYDQVFRATLETLERRQFPITEADRDAGRIITGTRPVQGIEARRRVERARARVEDKGGEVDVRLFLTFRDQGRTTWQRGLDDEDEAVVDKALRSSAIYDAYLDAIENRVAGLRGGG
ncbi:hypothetical protein [Salinibacter grassmerensis]|uniref:hypothetical protein n=1 Tax=Salinibacter grassmerensis TaxID=3040353 RepID=UPI0021E81A54|nr:hypothetical protein [Salinibacter grassmerensis]